MMTPAKGTVTPNIQFIAPVKQFLMLDFEIVRQGLVVEGSCKRASCIFVRLCVSHERSGRNKTDPLASLMICRRPMWEG